MPSLKDAHEPLKERGWSSEMLQVTVEEVRLKDEDSEEGLLEDMSDAEVEGAAHRASSWLLTMLAQHEQVLNREHLAQIFRRVVEMAMRGTREERLLGRLLRRRARPRPQTLTAPENWYRHWR
jgi:hypothetical protein